MRRSERLLAGPSRGAQDHEALAHGLLGEVDAHKAHGDVEEELEADAVEAGVVVDPARELIIAARHAAELEGELLLGAHALLDEREGPQEDEREDALLDLREGALPVDVVGGAAEHAVHGLLGEREVDLHEHLPRLWQQAHEGHAGGDRTAPAGGLPWGCA
jgi:hypothetical protein